MQTKALFIHSWDMKENSFTHFIRLNSMKVYAIRIYSNILCSTQIHTDARIYSIIARIGFSHTIDLKGIPFTYNIVYYVK